MNTLHDFYKNAALKRLFTLLILVLMGGAHTFAQVGNIFGGTPINISTVPHQVSLEYSFIGHGCGGSIINSEWVLTAGHCVTGNTPIMVHAGATDQTNNNIGQRVGIDQIITHPNFDGSVLNGSDVALLHLSTPLCFNRDVQPIKYATSDNITSSDLAVGNLAFISGWGDSGNGCCNAILLGASLPIISDATANTLLNSSNNQCSPDGSFVGATTIAFFQQGIAAGPGDSGGPAFITKSDGTRILIGASSWGGCPRDMFPTMYADVLALSDFITDNITASSCSCDGQPLEITQNTLFSQDMVFSDDIIVKPGAELLIEATIGMAEGKRILVERNARLVVDNGGVVTRGCGPDWAGIQVLGNSQKAQPERFAPLTDPNQAGIVWIDNATIEWARCGVTAGGGYGPEFWGGLVWTNKTLFRNNRKDVEFMSYKFTTNKSRFFHTKFIEDGDAFANTEGVTIWETDDIEFHNCTFSNMDFEGIRTYDAGVRVLNSNVFQDNETGISSYATYPMTNKIYIGSGTSTENMFSNNKYHVHASLATGFFGLYSNGKFSLDVVNNNFKGGEYGVIVDGPSNFGVAGNLFTGVPIGTWAANTGYNNLFNQNLIGCNRYNGGSNLGILAIGENKEMQFLANDFDMSASGRDFILTNSFFPFLNGSIASQQGNPFVSASNCFTNPGTQTDILTWGTTNPFVYFYPWGEPDPACEQEPLTLGNYTKQAIKAGPFVVDCSRYGGLPRGMGEPDPRDLETRRKELQLLAQGTAGGDANAAAKYYQLLQEKEAILKYLLTQSLENKDFKTTEELLKGEGSTAADWAIFGLRMERKAYDEAAAWLNELPARNETELEFKAVQQINLERLQKPEGFQLSEDQEAYLTSVAESGSPVRGYARGILGLLKDRRFYPEAYEIGDGKKEAQERSAMVAPNAGLKTFPSPVSDNLTVTWPSLSQGATVELKVIDMLGKVRMQAAVGNGAVQHNLEVTPLDNGVYNLILVENGKAVQRTKFVVQK